MSRWRVEAKPQLAHFACTERRLQLLHERLFLETGEFLQQYGIGNEYLKHSAAQRADSRVPRRHLSSRCSPGIFQVLLTPQARESAPSGDFTENRCDRLNPAMRPSCGHSGYLSRVSGMTT
jgi:hypothetical protein